MTSLLRPIRVVVASPGDVVAERNVVRNIIDELNRSVAADRGLRLEVAGWETDAYPGFHPDGPQGLIDPLLGISDCDLLVGIFWKRFGTPTMESQSGTEHEFRLAYEAWQKNRRPQLMVYFNQQPYNAESKEETDQWGQVLEFKRLFKKEGFWWPYDGESEFERLFRVHLTNFIRATYRIPGEPPAAPGTSPRDARPDYFAIQSQVIAQANRTFVGRVRVQEEFARFRSSHGRGYFIIRGGPGQGKTALAAKLVQSGETVHHFISRNGGRTDTRLILRSLLSQLLPLANASIRLPESVSELTKTFEELLPTVVARQKSLVIVIDALDELPAETSESPYLAADALPEGVFFVVTSRPGDRLDQLQERLFAVPRQLYELGPLDVAEMDEILHSRKQQITSAQVERIAAASQGNPLYLWAVADELQRNPSYDLQVLPKTVEGFFLNSTSAMRADNPILGEVLAMLAAARSSLSLRELGQLTAHPLRQVDEQGVHPIRQFLLEIDGYYSFYHTRFHEFVTGKVLYEDEVSQAHRKIAAWLRLPENYANEYRWASLAHHLFEAGDRAGLVETIDEAFLKDKVRRLGYAVLEDVELLARCLLDRSDPEVVGRMIALVEGLRELMGGDIIPEAAEAVHSHRPGPESFRTRAIAPLAPSIPGLDTYVAVLPKAKVPADFFEFVLQRQQLVVAIGDAPGLGLKSAFVARFLGNLFRKLAQTTSPLHLGEVLASLNRTIWGHDYFARVSMQCAAFDPRNGVFYIANAGHPYPVHYSVRRGKCDVLPVRGNLLFNAMGVESGTAPYEQYPVEIAPGDVIVLVSDGVTEGHVMLGDAYGYRFTAQVEKHARQSAREIGEAILDGWRAHPREEDIADDASIIVIAVR